MKSKNKKIFGTDGIRGTIGRYPVTPETFETLAFAFASWSGATRVCVANDTRHSAEIFVEALIQGFQAAGCEIFHAGMIPTPALPYLCCQRGAWGCMVTASHNGPSDQGLKIFSPHGTKLSRCDEDSFTEALSSLSSSVRPSMLKGRRQDLSPQEALEPYKASLPQITPAAGTPLVLDCAQGAYTFLAPSFLESLGFRLICQGVTPDGYNINTSGTQHPNILSSATLTHKAYGGIAFDGDGDRVMLCEGTGKLICGNRLLAFLALQGVRAQRMPRRIVLSETINRGVEKLLYRHQIACWRTAVGDRSVGEAMRQYHALLGGEPSGHILFNQGFSGDGLRTALMCLKDCLGQDLNLSTLLPDLELFHEREATIPLNQRALTSKRVVQGLKGLQPLLKAAEHQGVHIVIRPSGTEPVMRLRAEGQDSAATEACFASLHHQLEGLISSAHESRC